MMHKKSDGELIADAITETTLPRDGKLIANAILKSRDGKLIANAILKLAKAVERIAEEMAKK